MAMHHKEAEEQARSPPRGYSRPFLAEAAVHSAGELGREYSPGIGEVKQGWHRGPDHEETLTVRRKALQLGS